MSEGLSRREFLASGSVAAVALPAAAQDQPPNEPPPAPTDVVLAQIVLEYGDKRMDDAVLKEIHGDIQRHLARSALLSSFPLSNGDEPGFTFAAYRKDG